MKCDRLLSNLETGGPLRRRGARLHAVRCPRCAAVRSALAEAKRELATAAPLSDRQRQLWLQATRGAGAEQAVRRRRVGIVIAATIGAVVLIAAAVALWPKPLPPDAGALVERPVQIPVVKTAVYELDTTAALIRLEQNVALLESELDRVDEEAELLEARQRVTEILDQYGEW